MRNLRLLGLCVFVAAFMAVGCSGGDGGTGGGAGGGSGGGTGGGGKGGGSGGGTAGGSGGGTAGGAGGGTAGGSGGGTAGGAGGGSGGGSAGGSGGGSGGGAGGGTAGGSGGGTAGGAGGGGGTLTASQQIAAARATVDGTASVAISGALVTYLKPSVGTDPAGFFLQADQVGPAIFIAVDPATLTPVPAVGDSVSLTVTTMATAGALRQATAVTGFSRLSAGNAVSGLIQNLSAATDVVTAIDTYESELINIGGTISGTYASSGTAHSAAQLDTTGVTGNAGLKLRTPDTLKDSLDLATGCAVSVNGTPMWRFTTTAQPMAWLSSEVTISSCPAPKVLSAVATGATSVQVTFDRLIASSSITGSGAQFAFNGGLTASAAVASARQVTVTTAAQTGNQSYTVTVANTVTDTRAVGVSSTANTATFTGFLTPAQVVINEVNPNITGGRDLVELLVISGGTLAGMKLEQDLSSVVTFVTFPALLVATGDLIVVHMVPNAAETTETTTKGDCTSATCYAGAWDINGGTTGITFSNRVLVVRGPTGTIQDATPFFVTGNTLAAFLTNLTSLQAAGGWSPVDCGGLSCTYATTPTATAISVNWGGAGSAVTGNSIQRKPVADTNTAADWNAAATANSFGAVNP